VFLCQQRRRGERGGDEAPRRWGSRDGGGRFEILSHDGSFPTAHVRDRHPTGQRSIHQVSCRSCRHPARPVRPTSTPCAERCRAGDDRDPGRAIQGEGGVVVPRPGYLRALRELCDRRELLLILDEIRPRSVAPARSSPTSTKASPPDIMTLAKALGGGVPIGAMCTTDRIASAFTPGSHGTTFGGNPLACAAAVAAGPHPGDRRSWSTPAPWAST